MKLVISDPVVVAAGPESAKTGWGVYQFPDIVRLSDGRLMITFADSSDTIDAYGAERGCYVSSNEGKTWEKANERALDILRGILLDNGDRIQFIEQDSIVITEDMELPPVVGKRGSVPITGQTRCRKRSAGKTGFFAGSALNIRRGKTKLSLLIGRIS